jgi:hypothetical protein
VVAISLLLLLALVQVTWVATCASEPSPLGLGETCARLRIDITYDEDPLVDESMWTTIEGYGEYGFCTVYPGEHLRHR